MDVSVVRENGAKLFPLLSWTRPRSYWDVIGAHLPLSFMTGMIFFLSSWVPLKVLPLRQCTFLWLTGYPCPFCGFTRSFQAMAEGGWGFAFYNCPLACLTYVVAALVFTWNTAGLLLGVKVVRGRFLRLKPRRARWVIAVVIVLLILNWAYRLGLGLK